MPLIQLKRRFGSRQRLLESGNVRLAAGAHDLCKDYPRPQGMRIGRPVPGRFLQCKVVLPRLERGIGAHDIRERAQRP